jgi:UDP-hydrolysing UDP-N-acetyl-D-glucosamine 2-epimerase
LRTIAAITVGRSDYGIYRPILRRILADPELGLQIVAAGAHLSPAHGLTIREVENEGFAIAERVEMLLASDAPEAIAESLGLGIIGFSRAYARLRPELILVLGDRFEMHAAALAALPMKIPVAHIQGGELTMGAIDDALRHSITKLSHLHFVATEEYGRRVRQLGEEPWRITVCGAPSLDNLESLALLSKAELAAKYGFALEPAPLLVTFHPVTLEYEDTAYHIAELLAALDDSGMPAIFTMPNADTSNHVIAESIRAFVAARSATHLVDNLGTQGYFSVMAQAAAMVGNSSSGIIEAASFRLPVVNIGTRQQGRVRGANVLDVGYSRREIAEGIRRASNAGFRSRLADLENPYGTGGASSAIVKRLKSLQIDSRLLQKRFFDVPERSRKAHVT